MLFQRYNRTVNILVHVNFQEKNERERASFILVRKVLELISLHRSAMDAEPSFPETLCKLNSLFLLFH